MTVKTFEFDVPEGVTAESLMQQAKTRAREVGITIQGDASGGSFVGTADGNYAVEGRTVRIEVEKKPAFVPWALVEKGLRRTFG